MLARLGLVLYLFSWVAAIGMLAILAYGAQTGMYTIGYIVFGGAALVSIVIGRAFYYVLSGR